MYFHYRNFSKERVAQKEEVDKGNANNPKSTHTYDNTSSVNGFDSEYSFKPSSDKITLLDKDVKSKKKRSVSGKFNESSSKESIEEDVDVRVGDRRAMSM